MQEHVLLYMPFRSEAVNMFDNNRYKQLYEDNRELIASKRMEYNPANNDDIVAELIERQYRQQEAEDEEGGAEAEEEALVLVRAEH